MLPGTVGLCWDGQWGTPPRGWQVALTGTIPAPLGRTQGAERSCGGIVQVAKDSHVLLTQVGTRLEPAPGQTHLPGRLLRRHARRLSSEIPAQIRPPSAPAPLRAPASPGAGDSPCGPEPLPASCSPC